MTLKYSAERDITVLLKKVNEKLNFQNSEKEDKEQYDRYSLKMKVNEKPKESLQFCNSNKGEEKAKTEHQLDLEFLNLFAKEIYEHWTKNILTVADLENLFKIDIMANEKNREDKVILNYHNYDAALKDVMDMKATINTYAYLTPITEDTIEPLVSECAQYLFKIRRTKPHGVSTLTAFEEASNKMPAVFYLVNDATTQTDVKEAMEAQKLRPKELRTRFINRGMIFYVIMDIVKEIYVLDTTFALDGNNDKHFQESWRQKWNSQTLPKTVDELKAMVMYGLKKQGYLRSSDPPIDQQRGRGSNFRKTNFNSDSMIQSICEDLAYDEFSFNTVWINELKDK